MMHTNDLKALLPAVIDAVEVAGRTLLARFSADARPDNLAALLAAIEANDVSVSDALQSTLLHMLPGSHWVDDEEGGGPLPDGEWWIVDAVEGNVNHIHGSAAWAVSATLVVDGLAVLTVVSLPAMATVYAAVRGQGATVNGMPLQVSRKTQLHAAIVGTGQARPGEGRAVHAAIGASVFAMLESALLVRMAVPATLELIEVASGRMDGFWQYSQVRSGLAAGALLVAEAGGVVTDTHGQPWSFASLDMLAAAPGIHAAAVACLRAAVDLADAGQA
ncbi:MULTISPECIES: inositol monophosphatase family protein [unclassified Janthinobacterium]|uniref:inositol monophosphatase family protein n=1 Tax=unclassified Janthinobacterium TaxID=2610881 RepID=UPI00161E382D|nr:MULTISPECIES: inositol monophosphatase family protein [unclassified Janthinobacterium]MBB5367121.1 myo-inositol-1(or 4)-monophosphatase [Janthinobacterium sp. K2C7]MBB5380401.1 myo-inositol-1(or 4)-monophosphatase [Janthinobacterium sp. K2Li3]MBB5385503.1 myo-inositol-1(or 4)-monophosphatase [Janthinobacterium sp. K2E3]